MQSQCKKSYFGNYTLCSRIKKELVRVSCQIKVFRMIPIDQMVDDWLMNTFFTRFRA